MRDQKALTVFTRIRTDGEHQADLADFLTEIGDDAKNNPHVKFREIGTTCFASWIILDNDPHYPPALALEVNYEGKLDAYLKEFIQKAGPALHRIYGHCTGYDSTVLDPAILQKYLKEHIVPISAFFVGCPYQSHRGVLNALETRKVIQQFLGQEPLNGRLPSQLRKDIEQHLQEKIAAGELSRVEGTITPLRKLRALRTRNTWMIWIVLVGAVLLLLAVSWKLLVGIVVAILALLAPLLMNERKEAKKLDRGTGKVDPRLFRSEDRFLQNHLTTLVDIKPGRLRFVVFRFNLWLINLLASYVYITGDLGGIPTIHFARWLIVDRDQPIKRLLFLSNFDGSWHSYLGDFVDQAWFGLNTVWGHTGGFPPTRFLLWGGSKHIVEFKEWSREHNRFAHVWYSAYQDTSVRAILDAIDIAEKTGRPLSEKETEKWLRQL